MEASNMKDSDRFRKNICLKFPICCFTAQHFSAQLGSLSLAVSRALFATCAKLRSETTGEQDLQKNSVPKPFKTNKTQFNPANLSRTEVLMLGAFVTRRRRTIVATAAAI